jgi:16S rRNA processing protein RimM
LVKAHGLKGALKLELYTDSPELRFAKGNELMLQVPEDSEWFGKTVTVKELRWYNQSPVLFLDGIDNRDSAEALVRAILLIEQPLDELPKEPDTWYDHQLVGLEVRVDNQRVGEVIRVDHLPAQDLLIVKTESDEVMVPFVSVIVPEVRQREGYLVVTPPEGLFVEDEQ